METEVVSMLAAFNLCKWHRGFASSLFNYSQIEFLGGGVTQTRVFITVFRLAFFVFRPAPVSALLLAVAYFMTLKKRCFKRTKPGLCSPSLNQLCTRWEISLLEF